MRTKILLGAFMALLKFCQPAIIMIYPDIQKRFIEAKNPKIYNMNEDPFDLLNVDERIELCDDAIKSATYMWHAKEQDMWDYEELPVTDNYQRKYKRNNNKYKEEVNKPDPVGVKLNDHESVPFKRIYCSIINRMGYSQHRWYQELYVSYGSEAGYPFVLARNGKNEMLEVMGVVDKNEVTWKPLQEKESLSELVENLSEGSKSFCAPKDDCVNYEVCSRVHYHMYPSDYDSDYEHDEDDEEYENEDDYSGGTNEEDDETLNDPQHHELGDDYDSLEETSDDDSSADGEKVHNVVSEHSYGGEEGTNPHNVTSMDDDSFKKADAKDNLSKKSNVNDDLSKKANVYNYLTKNADLHADLTKNASKEVALSENAVMDDDDLSENDSNEEEDYEEYDDDEYYAPKIFDWFDRGEKGCGTRNVATDGEATKTLPVQTLACVFGESKTERTETFVALKKKEDNKVTAFVMTPKKRFYDETDSPLEVKGTFEFTRH